jgi:outer membrane lipoprotein LolB
VRFLLLLFALLWMSGCSVAPVTDTGNGQRIWPVRQELLTHIQAWQLNGRVAVSTEDDGFNATLSWKQHPGGTYDLRLIAPFNQGTVSLQGDGGGVLLKTSESEYGLYAPDAETVLYEQFGWRVPVEALHFWVRGIPAPDIPADIRLDNEGRLTQLQQSSWQVRFLRYRQVQEWQLPDKIFIENGEMRVRIVIQDWQPEG